jgi:hypothetical protein
MATGQPVAHRVDLVCVAPTDVEHRAPQFGPVLEETLTVLERWAFLAIVGSCDVRLLNARLLGDVCIMSPTPAPGNDQDALHD